MSCLLRTALESDGPNIEDFDALLASVNVPDRDWQLGNYRILEEIGRGGMGVIYRARHAPSRRIVALKRVLSYHSDSRETLSRFQREATAAASLDHPNILPIYDVGATDDGLPFFSMKFAAGGSLLECMESFRENPRRSVDLIAKVSRALDHAHGKGILHRDLKPGNILLDVRGEPMVSDFGLAKWLDTASDLTRTMTVFGTPGYIAPEQWGNGAAELTPATDVYSIGAILFELLTGRPPFLGEHAISVIRQAAERTAPRLRSIKPRLDRDLDTICAHCLENEPEARYRSAAELAQDLECWLEGRPIAARPVAPATRLYRWSRRNPFHAGTLSVCLLFGAAVITRQTQNWQLANTVRETELARNSVAVLPFLDLDGATQDVEWTRRFVLALQTDVSQIGNGRILAPKQGPETTAHINDFGTRTVLSGTRRKTNTGMRLSVQLADSNGDVLFDKIVDVSQATSDPQKLSRDLAPAIYSVLNAKDWSDLIAAKRDPALRNQHARELIMAGRELGFHYTVQDFDRARSCFEKALQLEPQSALTHAYLANSAAARTHYVVDEALLSYAENHVKEALRLAPNSTDALRVLAGIDYQRGQLGKALETALRAVETNAPNGMSFALLGMIHNERGRPDQALRWYELAKKADRRPGEYDCHIGDCWAALNNSEKAAAAYRGAMTLHPERSEGFIGIGRLYLLNADFMAARRVCQENSSIDHEATDTTSFQAQIEFFARNFSEAQRLYEVLEEKDPDGGGMFYGAVSYKSALGRLALNKTTSRSGRVLLQQCLERELKRLRLAPDNPDVLYRISAIESSLGKTELAIKHLCDAVEAGWIDYRSLSLDPRFDAVANDVRLETIIGKLKLKVEDFSRAIEDDL